MAPMLTALLNGPPPIPMVFWDGSALGAADGPGKLIVRTPDALRRIVWAPGELGFSRAFVEGDLEVEGPLAETLRAMQRSMPGPIGVGLRALPSVVAAARRLGVLRLPPPAPAEELRPGGVRHSIGRDRRAVSHHYDVGNEFYRLVLGPSLTG